jgi:hypothetical protein
MAPEAECSSPCSQRSAAVPILSQLNPLRTARQANLPNIHSDPTISSTTRSSEWSLSFGLSHQNLLHFSLLSYMCHMTCPPHSLWFDLLNEIWRSMQIMNLLIVQLYPLTSYFIPLTSKYSPHNPVFKLPQSVCAFHLMWETKFHNHTKQVAEWWCYVF